jgi:hypothetical protein
MSGVLNSSKMQELTKIVEEAARSTKEGVKFFVEPAAGTLQRAVNKRHHLIFGRRGSGKSSLLRKAAADLTVERRAIAEVDLEAFKNHSYPDLLLSVLIATLKSFQDWLKSAAVEPASKTTFWKRWFGTKPKNPPYDKNQCNALSAKIKQAIDDLEKQLYGPETADVQTKASTSAAAEFETEESTGLKAGGLSLADKGRDKQTSSGSQEMQEQYKREKVDYLRRRIMDYQAIFDEMAAVANGDAYLFLDDLYHIRKVDQPRVVDYMHSVAKGHRLWLKIGTIRHRSQWYIHSVQPLGVKLGDDADEIDLDLTLEKYALAKDFLVKVLAGFAQTVGLTIADFLTDGAVDRLVLASGGVARDFLTIFRRAVDATLESGQERITAEEINKAAGEHDSVKRQELRRDTYGEEETSLNAVFTELREFCLETAKTNCFLLDKDSKGPKVDAIHELVDLKLLHLVRSRVTVPKRQGRLFEAYMLDLSQYAGARAKRGLSIVEFWKAGSDDQLRKVALIYTATQQTEQPETKSE